MPKLHREPITFVVKMSGKRPGNSCFEAVLESRVGKNGTVLFPRVYRALSFEEICTQALARCDDCDVEIALGGQQRKAGSPYTGTYLGSPFCVIPSFDDICALHGIANTTELENVEFTDMLTEEQLNIDAKGASTVWPDLKSDLIKDIKLKHERFRDDLLHQNEKTGVELQSHSKLEQGAVPVAVGDHGSTDCVTIKNDHGDSGATLINKFHGNRKRAKTDKSTQLKENCRKTINQRVGNENGKVKVTPPDLQLPSLNSDKATHLSESSDARATVNDLNGKVTPGTIDKDTENTDGREVFAERTGTTSHSKEAGSISTESSAEKTESLSSFITSNAQNGRRRRRRKIFSGQKVESICQKLMKMRDQKSSSSSPENGLSEQRHPIQTTDNQVTATDRVGETSRSMDHKSKPKEEVFEENRRRSQDSQLMSCDTSPSNDVTRHVADVVVSHPAEPLCDLFSSPSDSYDSITSTDTVDW